MGLDVARREPAAKEIFGRAREVLGYDLLALQAEGPEEKLRHTQFSQPAIFATNIAIYRSVGRGLRPVASAGHSFGEICSLTIAGAVTFEEALQIVDERGKAMQFAADQAPGGMSAVLGLDAQKIQEVLERINLEKHLRLQLANFNSPTQIVISGDLAAVQAAGDAMVEAGAKRVVPLNVSGAWHSALMDPAVERFARAVNAGHFRIPVFSVISNVNAQPYTSVESIKHNLILSITQEVRWHETAQRLLECNLDLVVEFGANPVLAPLMRRLPNAPTVMNVSDFSGIQTLRSRLAQDDAVEV